MKIVEKNYKEKIEDHAVEYFKDLHIYMPPQMIAKTISFFEFSLSKEGLVDDVDYEITHCNFIQLPKYLLIDIEPVVYGVASIYGSKPIKLYDKNSKQPFVFSFVGYKGDVHACYVSLIKLVEFIQDIRKAFIASVTEDTGSKPKKSAVDDYMYQWIEQLSSNLAPTAITGDDDSEFKQYIAENFRTKIDDDIDSKELQNIVNILRSCDEDITCQEFSDLYHKKTGKNFFELVESQKKTADLPRVIDYF